MSSYTSFSKFLFFVSEYRLMIEVHDMITEAQNVASFEKLMYDIQRNLLLTPEKIPKEIVGPLCKLSLRMTTVHRNDIATRKDILREMYTLLTTHGIVIPN